jgi:hypothetical protein
MRFVPGSMRIRPRVSCLWVLVALMWCLAFALVGSK